MFLPFCGLFFSPCYKTYPAVVPTPPPYYFWKLPVPFLQYHSRAPRRAPVLKPYLFLPLHPHPQPPPASLFARAAASPPPRPFRRAASPPRLPHRLLRRRRRPSRQPGHARWRDRAAARPTTHGGAAKRRAWRPGGARSVDRGGPRAGDPTRGPGGGPRLAAAANTASGCLGPGASHHCSPTHGAGPGQARLGLVRRWPLRSPPLCTPVVTSAPFMERPWGPTAGEIALFKSMCQFVLIIIVFGLHENRISAANS